MNNTTTFWDLLTQHRIEIPIIQRDYAQGRSNPASKEIRTNFIQQIKEALDKEDGRLHLNFVYGKIYGKSNAIKIEENKEAINGMLTAVQSYSKNLDLGIKWDFIETEEAIAANNQTSFSPLDGQQRLTTLFLLHWYLMPNSDECRKILTRFNYKIRPSSKDFCEALVANKPDLKEVKETSISKYISNASWFFTYWRNDPTVRGMLRMLDEIHWVFKTNDLDGYWKKLTEENKLCFEFLDLDEFKLTDELYIKMNARGVALTPFENFKAWLIEYIQANKIEINNKKLTVEDDKTWIDLLDTTWTDLFWANKDDENMLIDEELMRYFRNMMQIFLVKQDDFKPNNDSKKAKDDQKNIEARQYREKASLLATDKDKNTGEYKYVPNSFFADNQLLSTENLNILFDSIHFLSKNSFYIDIIQEILGEQEGAVPVSSFGDDRGSIFKRFIDKDTSYRDKVVFYALYVFMEISDSYGRGLNKQALRSWIRVTRNLVENSTIDSIPTFKRAIESISALENNCLSILQGLKDDKLKLEGFDGFQITEEIRKSKLILDEAILISEDDFLKYENHRYFRGQITFLIELTEMGGISFTKKRFIEYAEKMANIFSHKLKPKDKGKECVLFERALLTEYVEDYNDYLYRVDSNYTFGTLNGDKTSWKKTILTSNKRLNAIRNLLDKLNKDDIVNDLEKICKSYTTKDWKYQLANCPSAINFCDQKFIRYRDDNDISLLVKTRMAGNHAELFSYCLYQRIKKDELEIAPFVDNGYVNGIGSSKKPYGRYLFELDSNKYELHLHYDHRNLQDGNTFMTHPYELKFFITEEDKNTSDLYDENIFHVLKEYGFIWKNEEKVKGFWKDFESDEEVIDFLEKFCTDLNKMQLLSNESVESCI